MHRIFITGGTGYVGGALIRALLDRGHEVVALARAGSEGKIPPGCSVAMGDALDGKSYGSAIGSCDTFVQLVGVARPSPSKAREFVEIDQRSGIEAVRAAKLAGVRHFVYVSVAHPAPVMKEYIAARSAVEEEIVKSGLNATILRPWYVLGPGHRWPYILIPFYWVAERVPKTRETARRLGLVTREQMVRALVGAVENPAAGTRMAEVPEIRASYKG